MPNRFRRQILAGCRARRALVGGLLVLGLILPGFVSPGLVSPAKAAGASGYGAMTDRGVAIQAVPLDRLPRQYRRQTVRYVSDYEPGTIVVDPQRHFLYLVQSGTQALRYGVSVGKGAFGWSGEAVVARKAQWPRWTPPAEMVDRSKNLSIYRKGLEGGLFNPLGARALYLHQGERDTLYRIHGTSEWWSIGDDASSGCIRLLNQDVIDLASRVPAGTSVVVLKTAPLWRRR